MIDKVVDKTCDLWGITKEDLLSSNTKRILSNARAMIVWYFRTHDNMSYSDVAKILHKSRTTIYYSVRVYEYNMKYDKEFIRLAKILERYAKKDVLKENIMNIINEIMYGSCNF